MKWGAKLPELREYERRSGRTPSPLRNLPTLLSSNYLYFIAYVDLTDNKITYEAINAYAELANLNKTELLVKVKALEDFYNGNNGS